MVIFGLRSVFPSRQLVIQAIQYAYAQDLILHPVSAILSAIISVLIGAWSLQWTKPNTNTKNHSLLIFPQLRLVLENNS